MEKPNRIREDLKKDAVSPVYLVLSNQELLLDELTSEVKQKLISPGNEAFNYRLFHADSCTAKDIITEARTLPFAAEKRLVVVRHLESIGRQEHSRARNTRKEEYSRIAEYAAAPSPGTCLLLTASVPEDKKDALYTVLCVKGVAVIGLDASSQDIRRWIESRFRENGKNIDDEAVAIILERCGGALMEAGHITDRILDYAGKRRDISAGDAEKMTGHRSYTIWNMLDAVIKPDTKAALSALESLFREGAEPYIILHMLGEQLRKVEKARYLGASGQNSFAIARQVGVSAQVAQKMVAAGRKLTPVKKKNLTELVLSFDLATKTGAADVRIAVEELLVRMCEEMEAPAYS